MESREGMKTIFKSLVNLDQGLNLATICNGGGRSNHYINEAVNAIETYCWNILAGFLANFVDYINSNASCLPTVIQMLRYRRNEGQILESQAV